MIACSQDYSSLYPSLILTTYVILTSAEEFIVEIKVIVYLESDDTT